MKEEKQIPMQKMDRSKRAKLRGTALKRFRAITLMKRSLKQKDKSSTTGHIFLLGVFAAVLFSVAFFGVSVVFPITYNAQKLVSGTEGSVPLESGVPEEEVLRPIRIKTPESVKAIYMTQCVAGTPSFREKLVRIAEETEINSRIIYVKDY